MVSMNHSQRCSELDALADWCVREKAAAPAAVVACVYRHGDTWNIDQGAAGCLAPGLGPVDTDTVFDLASLTKPVFALAVARLVRLAFLDWDMPIDVLLRESHGTPSASVPLEMFLAHRSGLHAHLPLYEPLQKGAEVSRFETLRRAANARRPECGDLSQPMPDDGFAPVYSDLGYLLLGEAVARATRVMLDELVACQVCRYIGARLGSVRQHKRWNPGFLFRVAPTENVSWRGGLLCGAVHDDNAWAVAAEGMCAHAGLFATARDVAILCAAVLDVIHEATPAAANWLCKADIEPLIRKRKGGTLRAGFDGKSDTDSSAGNVCSESTFGHLGFTGTSMWIDPDNCTAAVLLTNRVYPDRENMTIKQVRPEVNDALFTWAARRASTR